MVVSKKTRTLDQNVNVTRVSRATERHIEKFYEKNFSKNYYIFIVTEKYNILMSEQKLKDEIFNVKSKYVKQNHN